MRHLSHSLPSSSASLPVHELKSHNNDHEEKKKDRGSKRQKGEMFFVSASQGKRLCIDKR